MNSPYLSLDTINSLQSCPFNQCLIDATVEVKVNLFQNRILSRTICFTAEIHKDIIILKSSVIITEKYKINHSECQSQNTNIDLCFYMTLYHINVKSLEDMNNHISGGKHQRKLDTSPVCTTKLILYSDQNI